MSMLKKFGSAAFVGALAFGSLLTAAPASAASGLCAVTSDSADEEWITGLKLGSNPAIASEQSTTYKDMTATSVGTFKAGTTNNSIEFTVNVDLAQMSPGDPAWQEFVFVWLDLNQDGQVDLTTERIFADSETTDNFTQPDAVNQPTVWTYTFTGNFAVPASAFNGEATGRAMLQFVDPGDQPVLCNSDPNALDPNVTAFEFGSTLDFKVGIEGGVENPATAKPTLAETGAEGAVLPALVGLLLVAVGARVASRR